MRRKFSMMLLTMLLTLCVSAQPPRKHHRDEVRDEARRLTEQVDRKVGGLGREQRERVFDINMRFASHKMSREQRNKALRRVLSEHQWDRYMGRDGHRRGPGPGPQHQAPNNNRQSFHFEPVNQDNHPQHNRNRR